MKRAIQSETPNKALRPAGPVASAVQFKQFDDAHHIPSPSRATYDGDNITMDNLKLVNKNHQPVKYCVQYINEAPLGRLNFKVTCVEHSGNPTGTTTQVQVGTNLQSVSTEKRIQRTILDILKDGAAGGATKERMKELLTQFGFDINSIKGVTIDGLIDELKGILHYDFTTYPKTKFDERSVDGLYKMCLFLARLLFLETGSLSKFSSFKVFEKGIWRACNAFIEVGGAWNGVGSLLSIIASSFALQFQTFATLMDPASPCQSPLTPSMRSDITEEWWRDMYGLTHNKKNLRIRVLQDWCNSSDNIQTESAHYVPTDATFVTLQMSCDGVADIHPSLLTTSAFVYSTVPQTCMEKWSQTPIQYLGDFSHFLQGNPENGTAFNNPHTLDAESLRRMIGKENGDCNQVYEILFNAIQFATHRYLNQSSLIGKPGYLTWDDCFTEIMKEIMMVTCDRVVYYTCMCLRMSCTYTGSGDGNVHVYEPYKSNLPPEEKTRRDIDLSKRKLYTEADNLVKFLSSQNKLLSTAIFSITSVRYENNNAVGHITFPNNCYSPLKENVKYKKNRLDTVSVCVSNIKEKIEMRHVDINTIANLVAQFALAVIITNVAVISSNVNLAIGVFNAAFKPKVNAYVADAAAAAVTSAFGTQDVIDVLNCTLTLKMIYKPVLNSTYITSTAEKVGELINVLMQNPDNNIFLYLEFLSYLYNCILKDENNKCVSTTQEPNIYAGYLIIYILKNSCIPSEVFSAFTTDAARQVIPITRARTSISNIRQGGGGNTAKKTSKLEEPCRNKLRIL
jgi:hypothetical protein